MMFRVSAGAAVLAAAEFIASDEALAPMSVESPFLAFDFADMGHDESLAAVDQMDACVGLRIADADSDEVARALSALKGAIAGLKSDLHREYMIRARASEATSTQSGSHPTSTGDSLNEVSPQQSSIAVNEETSNGTTQERSGRSGGRGQRNR